MRRVCSIDRRPHPLPVIYAYSASASDYTCRPSTHYLLYLCSKQNSSRLWLRFRCRCNHRYAEPNGTERHAAASTCLERLRITAEQFDLFENTMVWVQYPRRSAVSSSLNHCNCSSQFRGSPVKETIIRKRTICPFADLLMWCFNGALQQR